MYIVNYNRKSEKSLSTSINTDTVRSYIPCRNTCIGNHCLPDPILFTSSHIGSNEASTGDYFGRITVAAAYVDKKQSQQHRLSLGLVVIEVNKFSQWSSIQISKGASTKVEQTIAKIIRNNGTEILDKCAKTFFQHKKSCEIFVKARMVT